MRPAALRHLTRNERELCVMARAQRMGLRFYRCFALRQHGSWEAAEAAARLWLRPVLAELAKLPPDRERLSTRNRSGMKGVFFRARPRFLKSGRVAVYPSYVARWPGAPAAGVTWMFTSSGGEDGAFLRACMSRELATADRVRVEWAVRALSPERRDELLARRRPIPEIGALLFAFEARNSAIVAAKLDEIEAATELRAKLSPTTCTDSELSEPAQAHA